MPFIAPQPTPKDPDIENHPFFPPVSPADMRNVITADGTVTPPRLLHALADAMQSVNRDLRGWRQRQQAAGFAQMADVPDEDPGRLPQLYRRAVYSLVMADLMERMIGFDATGAGQRRAETQETTADDHRRNAFWAIRDIQGEPRLTVELI